MNSTFTPFHATSERICQKPKFFCEADISSVAKEFLDKGWIMSIHEPAQSQIELHWTPISGEGRNCVSLDYGLLYSMRDDKARAVAWLKLFAVQAEKIN
jgi:hypothetical protein